MRRPALSIVLALVGAAAVISAVIVAVNLLRGEPDEPITFDRPAPGETRPDYLPDGTPVWVVGHEDGTVSVLDAFDTHTPANLGKLTWWCVPDRTVDNPHHGSRWDEYGVKVAGPAPAGLASWDTVTQRGQVMLGERRAAPPLGEPGALAPEPARSCATSDDEVLTHTFEGWPAWNSPGDAVESATNRWVVLNGELGVIDGRAVLCGAESCEEVAVASFVEVPPPGMDPQFSAFGHPAQFIARVRDGALVDLAMTANVPDEEP